MDEQHGFHTHRSTVTCKTVFCNFDFDAFATHSRVDVINTDFDKTFDRVDHYTLIHILFESGFGEPLLS